MIDVSSKKENTNNLNFFIKCNYNVYCKKEDSLYLEITVL